MKFYRIKYHAEGGGSNGYGFFTNRATARLTASKYDKEHPGEPPCEITAIEVEPTRRGILRAPMCMPGTPTTARPLYGARIGQYSNRAVPAKMRGGSLRAGVVGAR